MTLNKMPIVREARVRAGLQKYGGLALAGALGIALLAGVAGGENSFAASMFGSGKGIAMGGGIPTVLKDEPGIAMGGGAPGI